MSNQAPAQVFAAHLLAALNELGVTQVFLSPGSRSQALAIAAAQLHDAKRLTLRVRVDERSMAFMALGAAKATERPVALITTSGTAVANLHPAVLEAHHSGIPLILLTADRPGELRNLGANQTTNQVGIFSDAVRECIDQPAPNENLKIADVVSLAEHAVAVATGSNGNRPGPVQLNLCFAEPLSSSEPKANEITTSAKQLAPVAAIPEFVTLDGAIKTVVVAGSEAGLEALELAEAFGWPIFAEPSSRARHGANAIAHYQPLLGSNSSLAKEIARVIVLGKPTLSREVNKLISRNDVELIVVRSKRMGPFDPFRNAKAIVDEVSVTGEVDQGWLANWREASQDWIQSAQVSNSLSRRTVIEAVYESSEFDDAIVIGASRMIREANVLAPVKPIQVFSNRGLSGIDGTVATATGIALNAEGAFTRVILGDLTLVHDSGSMIDDTGEDLNLQLIVVNDGGGRIFENLEVKENVTEEIFERVFLTPQKVDFWSLANAYGFTHVSVETLEQLREALGLEGRVLIEVKL